VCQRQKLVEKMTALRQGQQVLMDLERKKYGGEDHQSAGFGAASDSSDSFDIPTPQSEKMDEA
jgi:hypothetical protein